jgi:hypothetical protein
MPRPPLSTPNREHAIKTPSCRQRAETLARGESDRFVVSSHPHQTSPALSRT